MRLKDKVVLITASTRGIGLAIVKKCAEEGALVYMAARDIDRAQEIASTLHGVKCVYNDATKPETFTSMVEDVVQDAGRGADGGHRQRGCGGDPLEKEG